MNEVFNRLYIGFMRVITLNFQLWCKPTHLGWKRRYNNKIVEIAQDKPIDSSVKQEETCTK